MVCIVKDFIFLYKFGEFELWIESMVRGFRRMCLTFRDG